MSSYNRYPPRSRSSVPLWPLLFLLVLVVVLVWRFWPGHEHLTNPNAQPRTVTPRGPLAADEEATIQLFKVASPAVVRVRSPLARPGLFDLNPQQVPEGIGSGIVWDKTGRIVTNYHVIEGATAAYVTLADHPGEEFSAQFVGGDKKRDLAVLLISAPQDRLQPIALGESHTLQVGQKVFAIGNPFGLPGSLSTGVVSALGRTIDVKEGQSLKGVIQTDAPVNPGNSGGPLLDSAGRLIGVNTAIFTRSNAWAGIGFAIPVDDVNRVVTQLIRYGQVVRAGLGLQEAPDQVAKRLGISGVLILNVTPDGPAARAGLRATTQDELGHIRLGDVIVAIRDQCGTHKITSSRDLFAVLDRHNVGDTLTVTVLRNGRQRDKQVTLQAEQA